MTSLSTPPSELRLLALKNYKDLISQFVQCPCCEDNAIVLLVNWVYRAQQIVLVDCPVIYCLKTARMLLPKREEDSLRERLQGLREVPFLPLKSDPVGIGGSINRHLFAEHIQTYLGLHHAQYAPKSRAVVMPSSAQLEETDLPDAIAFHSNALPQKITLKIEPTTRCNFRCEFCYGRYIEQGAMRMADFLTILRRFPNISAVEITGEGEPLINRDIFEMVKICADNGIWTHITSNGSLINEESCGRLLASGLSSIAISLESLDPVQFARLRPGGDLTTIINAIRTISRLKKERASALQFSLWISIFRETLPQIEKIDRFAKEVEVDALEFQLLNSMGAYSRYYSNEVRKNLLTRAEIESLICQPNISSLLRSILASVVVAYADKKCDVFMSTAMIHWRGEVTPCCLLKPPLFRAFGSLATETFEEVWNSEAYRVFRFSLQHGVVFKSCMGCPALASA